MRCNRSKTMCTPKCRRLLVKERRGREREREGEGGRRGRGEGIGEIINDNNITNVR